MHDTIEREALPKEEAIHKFPDLVHEYRDVERAVIVAFVLVAYNFIQALIYALSDDAVFVDTAVTMFYLVTMTGLSFLALKLSEKAMTYLVAIVVVQSLTNTIVETVTSDIVLLTMVFSLIPVVIVFGLIFPAISSVNTIREHIVAQVEQSKFYRFLETLFDAMAWILIVLSLIGMMLTLVPIILN